MNRWAVLSSTIPFCFFVGSMLLAFACLHSVFCFSDLIPDRSLAFGAVFEREDFNLNLEMGESFHGWQVGPAERFL